MVAPNIQHIPGTRLIVVAYYRMSSDQQDTSIEQQQKEVRAYAERLGWVIIREYIDSGISGSKDPKKRKDYQKLLADSDKKDFNAVLCWDSSRFGRLDIIDAGEAGVARLRRNGIHLETVKEGRIDWNTEMGVFQYTMLAGGNKQYSIKLSGASVRGRNDVIRNGFWGSGSVPFGFDRQYISPSGQVVVMARNNHEGRPKGYRLKLAPNPEEQQTVEFMFQAVATGTSIRQLAKALNEKGLATPNGGQSGWTNGTVTQTLRNPAYLGHTQIRDVHKRRAAEAINRTEATLVKNTHPGFVDEDQWKLVQMILDKKKAGGLRIRTGRSGALTGIVKCGHCGFPMQKAERKSRPGEIYYVCSSPRKRPHVGCRQYRVHESVLVPVVVKEIMRGLDMDLLQKAQQQPAQVKEDVAPMKRKLAQCEKDVAKATRNLALSDAEIFPMMQEALVQLKRERDKLANTLMVLESSPEQVQPFVQLCDRIKANLVVIVPSVLVENTFTLGTEIQTLYSYWTYPSMADRDTLRNLLVSLKASVTLTWTQNGSRFFKLDTGVIRAEINGETVDKTLMDCGHSVSADSSKCSRDNSL